MDNINRDKLFVEVDQPKIKNKIFTPLYNLNKFSHRFFHKRFAILGDFRLGKTELGQYIIYKIKNHYQKTNVIAININSEGVKSKSIENIDNWIYDQWLITLRQVEDSNFKKTVKRILDEFKSERGYSCNEIPNKDFIEKINIICKIYKEYTKINKNVKYIVEFDQANVIFENEDAFIPFYRFWRNFQGFWEDERYFARLRILIFVVGHINWLDFVSLKEPSGMGIFDVFVEYYPWNNSDIYEMFKKRLEYSIKTEYHDELLDYFLDGIVDFFGVKLRKVNTVEYLKVFFGEDGYLEKYLKNFQINRNKYKSFLQFCRSFHKREEYDNTYFTFIEEKFITDTSTDYMPVFRYLRDNEEESWFTNLFELIEYLYNEKSLVFGSKIYNTRFKNLSEDFITLYFSFDAKNQLVPKKNPPIFQHYGRDLMLDRLFKDCLSGIPFDKQGPVYRLKRFVTSPRIKHETFLESKHGKEMVSLLKDNLELAEKIYVIVQKWSMESYYGVIEESAVISNNDLLPFHHMRTVLFKFKQIYKGNSTNWAQFDSEVRDLGTYILEEMFPKEALILSYVKLDEYRDDLLSELASNILIIRVLNGLLSTLLRKIEIFDTVIVEKNIRRQKSSNFEDEVLSELSKRIIRYKGDRLVKSDYQEFLNQFPDELKISVLKLLKRIIYFTQEEMTQKIKDIIERIHYGPDTKIFIGVFDDLVNKSNSYCSYLIKKSNIMSNKKIPIYRTSNLIDKIKTLSKNDNTIIIFIDDIIAKGFQFLKSYKKYFEREYKEKNFDRRENIKLYLITCIGSSESVRYISKNTLLNVDSIKYVKVIREQEKAFHKENWKDQGELERLKAFLKSIDPSYWDGWKRNPKDPSAKGSEFLVVTEWNVPNSTISCIWKETSDWKALFPRS